MNGNYRIAKITEHDIPFIVKMTETYGGNKLITESFLYHRYFNVEQPAFNMWKAVNDNKIVGYTAMGNFNFNLDNTFMRLAIPENALIAKEHRNKGLFSALYLASEKESTENLQTKLFATFPQRSSWAICKEKFKYKEHNCANLIIDLFSPFSLFHSFEYKEFKSINEVDQSFIENNIVLKNAIKKDSKYYYWRYSTNMNKQLRILQISTNNKVLGQVILKPQTRYGIPVFLIMDIITTNLLNIPIIISGCSTYASKKMYAGIIYFELADVSQKHRFLRLRVKNRFNFMVKSYLDREYEILLNRHFNFFLGDLDFI